MKVFISADIEGVNNICTWDETDNRSGEYQYFRKQMTEEVAAACRAAKEAGATEIFVKDAHDSARNLILKDLPEYALGKSTIISSVSSFLSISILNRYVISNNIFVILSSALRQFR